MKAPKTEPMKWGRRISETADCMAEREGFELSVLVSELLDGVCM
jgi:hypothetical protein